MEPKPDRQAKICPVLTTYLKDNTAGLMPNDQSWQTEQVLLLEPSYYLPQAIHLLTGHASIATEEMLVRFNPGI